MAQANIKAVITAEDRASRTIQNVGGSFTKMAAAMGTGQIAAQGINKAFSGFEDILKRSVGAAFDQVRQVENATIALRAYEKNGDKVNKVLKDLVAYARSDMGVLFQREDLFAAAQTLKIYGQETDTLTDKVKILSKGVSLGKTTFQELSTIVGRAAARGRLDAVDFDMLIERGIGLDESFRGAKVTSEELFEALNNVLPDQLLKDRANTIDGAFIQLQTSLRDIGSAILGVDKDTSQFIEGGLGDRFMDWVKGVTERLKDPEFKKAVEEWVEKIKTFIEETDWESIKNTIITIANLILGAGKAVGDVVGFFNTWKIRQEEFMGAMLFSLKRFPGQVKNALTSLSNILSAPFRTAFNSIANLWNNTVGKLDFKIPDWVPGIGGKGFGVPDIPTFDTGGVVPGSIGSPQLIMAHGGETVLPTHKTGAVGNTVNINVNVGMYAGTEMEKRKIAASLARAYQDAMGANSMAWGS